MVKLTCIAVLKWTSDAADPILLGKAEDLSSFGYFQRSSVREMLTFVTRTIVRRTYPGQRQSVEQDEYICHACNKQGLAGIVFADRTYPSRSAFAVLNKVLEDYLNRMGDGWKNVTADSTEADSRLSDALASYQDPGAADKFYKVEKELEETKVILHKTIDSVLARGEKLDHLVEQSSDLSFASQVFYKQARKTNACCVLQ